MRSITKPFFLSAVIFACLYSFGGETYADTHTAGSCSYADVSAAVAAASPGDTVNVPAGSCTWNMTLNLSKGIKLIGAGIAKTVITGTSSPIIKAYPSDWSDITNLYRISGFSFNLNSQAVGVLIGANTMSSQMYYTKNTPLLPKIRIDHNRFYNSTNVNVKAIENRCHMSGVVDNNQFNLIRYPIRNDSQGSAAAIESMWKYGFPYWSLGNDYTLYYEDNTFTDVDYDGSSAIVMDGQFGARYVARYNTIATLSNWDPLFDEHGEFGGDMVAGFGVEIYGNLITNHSGRFSALRGGSSVVFYNRAPSGAGASSSIQQDACPSSFMYDTDMITHDTYLFGNRNGETGSFFTEGVSRSTANCLGHSTLPVAGSEYFSSRSSPAVTMGTLANRPATCTTGQGYWATNQSTTDLTGMVGVNPATPISGTLYKCTSTNTWTAFYKPYTYPHPLREELDVIPPSATPSAPTNLRLSQ